MAPLKQYLMIPGPTPVPERVLQAMHRPMINHRGPDFAPMYKEITEGVQWAFQTQSDVFILPCSGTGGMEAAVVNFLSAGDKVLIINIGAFGSRFVKIAKAYGLAVDEYKVERGKAADLKEVEARLSADTGKAIKAVLFQQNETSTGVLNDVAAIARAAQKHGALTIVDAVSGLIAADLQMDAWGLDIVVSGSQKAFMIPPGLSMIAVSARAWKASETAKLPRFYFDLRIWREFAKKISTPVTPALSLLYGLQESLRMLRAEGLPATFKRHADLAAATRAGVRALGATCLADDSVASRSVTAVLPPVGIDPEVVRKRMREEYGFILAGGQEELKGKLFRIGHLGYVDAVEIKGALGALGQLFKILGVAVDETAGVKAAEEVLA